MSSNTFSSTWRSMESSLTDCHEVHCQTKQNTPVCSWTYMDAAYYKTLCNIVLQEILKLAKCWPSVADIVATVSISQSQLLPNHNRSVFQGCWVLVQRKGDWSWFSHKCIVWRITSVTSSATHIRSAQGRNKSCFETHRTSCCSFGQGFRTAWWTFIVG